MMVSVWTEQDIRQMKSVFDRPWSDVGVIERRDVRPFAQYSR